MPDLRKLTTWDCSCGQRGNISPACRNCSQLWPRLTAVGQRETMSYMVPKEHSITVRLDDKAMVQIANLADYFMEQDPLERDVPTSEVVRKAINMLYVTTFAEVIGEGDDA